MLLPVHRQISSLIQSAAALNFCSKRFQPVVGGSSCTELAPESTPIGVHPTLVRDGGRGGLPGFGRACHGLQLGCAAGFGQQNAGKRGGRLVAQGSVADIAAAPDSVTGHIVAAATPEDVVRLGTHTGQALAKVLQRGVAKL
jgi:hypothetical protein